MTYLAIEALLRQKTGLDAPLLGAGALARAVQSRLQAQNLTDLSVYLKQLQTSSQVLDELIEAVIVPETWFFRDREPFILLRKYVEHEWSRVNLGRSLRVLSVPCSTGEEPYSMAIALIELGLSSQQFQIDAVDISRQSLQFAQRAIYDKNALRGTDLAFQQRYFEHTTERYHLCQSIHSTVRFAQGNLVDPTFLVGKQPYDIIFCRNLLIYFDNIAREKAIQALTQLLAPKGLLFVGHAEAALLSSLQFTSVRHPFAFAYRKAEGSPRAPMANRPVSSQAKSSPKTAFQPHKLSDRPNLPATCKSQTSPSNQTSRNDKQPTDFPKQDVLSTARTLANQGHLQEAIQSCQAYLNENRTSAEGYTLLGQARQAMGHEEQAEQCFQKAIYLKPECVEALLHLALLKEQQGNIAEATVIRQRIHRLM
ncbi:chemotaxis protein CheR (plasmid) [Phormidium sp. CLA17]|uniref:CheR family methyltransferase n=1 Tax=Leptolyngbya sp. Cla-17 TaxID=2803751 RepID=UPI00149184C3|nr:CheR family methyltransferase [Leptolyngbya sp. Cla-17]MBM0745595.1 chemotaxis protein CheR [Leptolyngbya sp. Cla-17]